MKKLISSFLAVCFIACICAVSATPASAADNAYDLAITGVGANASNVYDEDKVTLFATVRNLSDTAVNGNFSVAFYIDGKFVQTVVSHSLINANAMKNITTTVESKTVFGSHKLTAIVNPDNQLGESDVTNNKFKNRLWVIDDRNPSPATSSAPDAQKTEVVQSAVTTIQAEDCTTVGNAKVDNKFENYTGKGYVLIQKDEGSGIQFSLTVTESASYRINFIMSNGSINRNTFILTMGSTDRYITVPAWRYSDVWSGISTSFTLTAGTHTFTLLTNSVVQNEMAIDRIEIRQSMPEISSFSFKMSDNPKLYSDIPCSISENRITATVSKETDISNLVATFRTSASSVKVSGIEQKSSVTANNFTNGQYYDCYDSKGNLIRRYTVVFKILKNSNLPVAYANITSSNPSGDYNVLMNGNKSDKDHVVAIDMSIIANTSTDLLYGDNNFTDVIHQPATIHIRGNSTSEFAKKGYKLKFDSKQKVLDMDNNKHWVLNANYDDKTMMRQYVGFEIARTLDNMAYTPQWRYINFFLNGNYLGVYIIGQNIRQGNTRVDINEMKAGGTDYEGGYIIELDGREDAEEELLFRVSSKIGNYKFALKEPDEDVATAEHIAYIQDYLTTAFNSLANISTGEYKQYFDVDSFVDFYVCAEICKVTDWNGFTSIYIYKDKGGKICAGPVWDFLPGFGEAGGSSAKTDGFYMKGAMWYSRFTQDNEFMEKVRERYKYFRENADALELINELEDYLYLAQQDNYDKWGTLRMLTWPNLPIASTYEEYVDRFYNWMSDRLDWLDSQWLS